MYKKAAPILGAALNFFFSSCHYHALRQDLVFYTAFTIWQLLVLLYPLVNSHSAISGVFFAGEGLAVHIQCAVLS